MPYDATPTLTPGQWNLITPGDTNAISAQNMTSDVPILLKATIGAVQPVNFDGIRMLRPTDQFVNTPLADISPGAVGANRVYAWCNAAAKISVSYA